MVGFRLKEKFCTTALMEASRSPVVPLKQDAELQLPVMAYRAPCRTAFCKVALV